MQFYAPRRPSEYLQIVPQKQKIHLSLVQMRSFFIKLSRPASRRSRCLFATDVAVKNLPFAVSSEHVGDLLAKLQLPVPQKVEVALTKGNKRPKGWAYVSYDNDGDADTAIEALGGLEYEGRKLKVRPP